MLYVALFLGSLRRAFGPQSALILENIALRQQLAVYQRRGARPRLRPGDRRFWSLLARMWPAWRATLMFVQPDTVIRWHRTAWRQYWTWKSRKNGPGRPRIDRALRELILQMVREGSVRTQGSSTTDSPSVPPVHHAALTCLINSRQRDMNTSRRTANDAGVSLILK